MHACTQPHFHKMASFHSGSHFCGSGAGDETTVRGWTKYDIMVLSQGKSLTSIYSIMYTVVMALHKQDTQHDTAA